MSCFGDFTERDCSHIGRISTFRHPRSVTSEFSFTEQQRCWQETLTPELEETGDAPTTISMRSCRQPHDDTFKFIVLMFREDARGCAAPHFDPVAQPSSNSWLRPASSSTHSRARIRGWISWCRRSVVEQRRSSEMLGPSRSPERLLVLTHHPQAHLDVTIFEAIGQQRTTMMAMIPWSRRSSWLSIGSLRCRGLLSNCELNSLTRRYVPFPSSDRLLLTYLAFAGERWLCCSPQPETGSASSRTGHRSLSPDFLFLVSSRDATNVSTRDRLRPHPRSSCWRCRAGR